MKASEHLKSDRAPPGRGLDVRLSGSLGGFVAKFVRAGLAGAYFTEVTETENAGRVAIRELNLNRVIPYRRRCFGGYSWLVHRQRRRNFSLSCGFGFLLPLVIAHGAGTSIAQIGKIVVAGMRIGPGDINALPGGNVDFQARRFFSSV
jgi:hypothetical protein